MAEQFLDGAQINSTHDPLRCPEMTEVMKANPFQLGFLASSLKRTLWIYPSVASVESGENVRTPDNANERPKLLHCKVRQGYVSRLSALRVFDRHDSLSKVDVIPSKIKTFLLPQSGF